MSAGRRSSSESSAPVGSARKAARASTATTGAPASSIPRSPRSSRASRTSSASAGARFRMRRSSTACCIRSSTRGRASSRRGSRSARATSTWCTCTATAFPLPGAARCSGRSSRGSPAWSTPCAGSHPRTARAGARRRCSSVWRRPARDGAQRGAMRRPRKTADHGQIGKVMRARGTAGVALLLLFSGVAWADTPPAAHGMPRVPATVAEWAQGARLFEGLGDFHRRVTTASPLAQQYFDQGMRFLWAFNHDEAARSFARAAELDPACAACYWGVALTVGPNYNLAAVEDARVRVALEALHRAQENAAHASDVEQGLIAALAARYPDSPPRDPANLEPGARAYAAAMRELAQRFPQDLDVQTLCAEAVMNVHAWELWTSDGQPAEGTPGIEAQLESVLRRDPNHPGANHYYIHVMEASPHPEKALAAAERLRGMMPAAGHLEHMPAHILQRIGRYEEAAEANRVYLAAVSAPDYYARHYLAHNYRFLAYSAAMEGRKAETLSAVQNVVHTDPLPTEHAMGGSGWYLTQQ